MNTPLNGKVALVTGGAKGYGLGITESLHASGAEVWIVGRDQSALDAVTARLGVKAIRADVTSPSDWDRFLEQMLSHSPSIDILVNNAGGAVKIAPMEEQTDESMNQAITLNLTSALYGCRRVAPLMKKQRSGTILNISSIVAHHAWPEWGIYAAAKAGLNQFSKSLYLELRPHGVRVSTLTPSWGVTEFNAAGGLGPMDAETLSKCIKPSELGQMALELCSLPSHLCVQETILWPMVQEVSPL